MSGIESDVRALYERFPYPSRGRHEVADLRDYAKWLLPLTGQEDPDFFRSKRVLEVGCGTGELACGLALNGALVTAVDLSSASIEKAKALALDLGLPNVSFGQKSVFDLGPTLFTNAFWGCTPIEEADSKKSPVPTAFDVVISLGVLHHTKDPQKAFEICSQMVAPGGLLIVGLYSKYGRWRHRLKRVLVKTLAGNDPQKRMKISQKIFFGGQMPKKGPVWLADKFGQAHESYHSVREAKSWCRKNSLELLAWKPQLNRHETIEQLSWIFDKKGAFFTFGARKLEVET